MSEPELAALERVLREEDAAVAIHQQRARSRRAERAAKRNARLVEAQRATVVATDDVVVRAVPKRKRREP